MTPTLSTRLLQALSNPETPDWAVRDLVCEENPHVASVYVVFGTWGSYSDRTEWYVAAFLDEGQAAAFRDRLNRWAKENQLHAEPEVEFNGEYVQQARYQAEWDGTRTTRRLIAPERRTGRPRPNDLVMEERAEAAGMDEHDYRNKLWAEGPDAASGAGPRGSLQTEVSYSMFAVPLRAEG